MATISEALVAYRICAKAEGKSPSTVRWITSSVGYFSEFLGADQDLNAIKIDDLRRFIIALQDTHKFRNHPYNKPLKERLSPQSIETYASAGMIKPIARVAFDSDTDGNREIYAMNANGSNPTRLTNKPASDVLPNCFR